jgi:sterol 14-demethylase
MDTTVSSIPLPDNYTWLILGCLIFPISCFYLLRTTFDGKLYDLGGLPILSVWSFFSKRYDFMRENLKLSRGLPFRFRILQVNTNVVFLGSISFNLQSPQYRVVGVSGPSGRKLFFNHSSLDMSEGYKILMGAAPRLEDMRDSLETSERLRAEGMKRIHFILQKDRMVESKFSNREFQLNRSNLT